MNKRLRISAILIMAGLFIELISLVWNHPLSFMMFLFVGGLLLAAGILFYLFSLTLDDRTLSKEDEPG
jgi:hypothetical protein